MPPHIIIMGIPWPIIVVICLQYWTSMSFMAGSIGVISQLMPFAVMAQDALHITIGIIIPPVGIPLIIGIIAFGYIIGIGIIAGIAIGFISYSLLQYWTQISQRWRVMSEAAKGCLQN